MEPRWLSKLESAVKTAYCRSDALRTLGLNPNGSGNHRTVQRWIDKLGLDCSHFDYRQAIANLQKARGKNTRLSDMEVFRANSFASVSVVKTRFRKISLYVCGECRVEKEYNSKPLTLQLDHINGNNRDHRLENLRWLCPNCHSQTETFSSRKRMTTAYENLHTKKVQRSKARVRKVVWPSKDELTELLTMESWTAIGRKFGVSDNSVRKWAKKYELI